MEKRCTNVSIKVLKISKRMALIESNGRKKSKQIKELQGGSQPPLTPVPENLTLLGPLQECDAATRSGKTLIYTQSDTFYSANLSGPSVGETTEGPGHINTAAILHGHCREHCCLVRRDL